MTLKLTRPQVRPYLWLLQQERRRRRGLGAGDSYPYKPISNHTRLPNEFGGASNNEVMAQSRHVFMEDMDSSMFRIGWANFRSSSSVGEVIPSSVLTGRASIHYYDRSGVYQIKRLLGVRSGTGTETGAPGEYVDFAETISALLGSPYIIRFWGQHPEGMNYAHYMADYTNGDIFRYGTTTTDLTGVDTTFTDTWQGARDMILPAYIEGVATRKTVGIVEDSRGVGIGDVPNNDYGLSGQFDRLLGQRMATVNVSVPGLIAADFNNTKHPRSLTLLKRADYLAYGAGTNDTIFQSDTRAQILASAQAVVSLVGKPAILKSIDPAAITTTIERPARESVRLGYSDDVVAVPAWATGAYDPRSVLENARTGQWASETYHAAGDSTHESNVGNQYAADNAGFNFALVGSPSVVSIIKPMAWDPANKASTVTLSNQNRTGTGTGSSPRAQARALRGSATGKKFFSIVSTGTPTVNQGLCLCNASHVVGFSAENSATSVEASGDGNVYGNGSGLGAIGGGAWIANDVIDMAVDLDAKRLWVRKNGGNWNNNAANNPATGVGGLNISYLGSGTIYPLDRPWPNTTHTVNFGASAYTYPAPAGFGNW